MREGHIQYLHNLQVDLQDADGDEKDDTDLRTLIADKDDSICCELGIRYPTLQAIMPGTVWQQEPPDHSGWHYNCNITFQITL